MRIVLSGARVRIRSMASVSVAPGGGAKPPGSGGGTIMLIRSAPCRLTPSIARTQSHCTIGGAFPLNAPRIRSTSVAGSGVVIRTSGTPAFLAVFSRCIRSIMVSLLRVSAMLGVDRSPPGDRAPRPAPQVLGDDARRPFRVGPGAHLVTFTPERGAIGARVLNSHGPASDDAGARVRRHEPEYRVIVPVVGWGDRGQGAVCAPDDVDGHLVPLGCALHRPTCPQINRQGAPCGLPSMTGKQQGRTPYASMPGGSRAAAGGRASRSLVK